MKIEVPHTKQSEDYITRVLSQYKKINNLQEVIEGRCIIHIYPYEDTQNDKGELSGFIDSYLCELHIYDCDNKTVFKTYGNDSVLIGEGIQTEVRIFKDLSTMIVLDGGVVLLNTQQFTVLSRKTDAFKKVSELVSKHKLDISEKEIKEWIEETLATEEYEKEVTARLKILNKTFNTNLSTDDSLQHILKVINDKHNKI